jgi:hypothetical protein
MLSFRSKEPNYAGMMKAIKEIVEEHRLFKSDNPFCELDNDNCNCCNIDICYCCNVIYPCNTINILSKYDIL